MLRLNTDFNEMTENDEAWLLFLDKEKITKMSSPPVSRGEKVILYPDEEDFEVTAVMDFRFVSIIGRESWVAIPEWSTIVRHDED